MSWSVALQTDALNHRHDWAEPPFLYSVNYEHRLLPELGLRIGTGVVSFCLFGKVRDNSDIPSLAVGHPRRTEPPRRVARWGDAHALSRRRGCPFQVELSYVRGDEGPSSHSKMVRAGDPRRVSPLRGQGHRPKRQRHGPKRRCCAHRCKWGRVPKRRADGPLLATSIPRRLDSRSSLDLLPSLWTGIGEGRTTAREPGAKYSRPR